MKYLVFAVAFYLMLTQAVFAAIGIDKNTSTDRSTVSNTISSPVFSTATANELLLAFISTDAPVSGTNTTVSNITGGSLTWILVRRTNTQRGTSEVWRAFAPGVLTNASVTATLSRSTSASLTVVTFTGADNTGTNGSGAIGATGGANAASGPPTANLTTTRNGSWVFGVGNDWDNAIARTVPANQAMVHQYLATVGDTYWVQRLASPTPASGTVVTVNDTAPRGDRYNLSIVEILPLIGSVGSTFSVTGAISPAASGGGAVVALTQGGTTIATTTTDNLGNINFPNVANGTYTMTPSKVGFTFSPASQQVTVNGANVAIATSFAAIATAVNWNISGSIAPALNGNGATLTLAQGGTTIATVAANSSGNFTFPNVANGTYVVAPSKAGFTFSPENQQITVNGANVTLTSFTATAIAVTGSISGTITPASSGSGAAAALTQNGTTVATATGNGSGNFTFANVTNGTYTVTPSKTGFTFIPTSRQVTVNGANVAVTFTAQSAQSSLLYPDLQVKIPTTGNNGISITGTGSSRIFLYTHETLNAGPGPLVIQPALNPASGNYQGTQYIYSLNSAGAWSFDQQTPLVGAFIFHAAHGHFHFPLVTFGLYDTSGVNGGPGNPVVISQKNGFCINDSFVWDISLPNASRPAINFGSCSTPTSLLGINIGRVDEYNLLDPGQSIPIPTLPDGTYWLKALADPNNYLVESDKSNNETDVKLTITGSTVQVMGDPVVPVLNTPPAIAFTPPPFVSGTVTLAASPATTNNVQYLVDGLPFGTVVSAAPSYNLSWDTRTVPDGVHWLAAQTTDSTGIIGTSEVASVIINNAASTGPVVKLTDPVNGSILSATVTLYATVASALPITNVGFLVDDLNVGTVSSPPYTIPWDTTTVVDGNHVIKVSATDSQSNIGNSQVTARVDNSHPANLIGKDATVSVDSQGVMNTPAISTITPNDLLLAFVTYDGPPDIAQTASVSGAGLTWTLVERSNTQPGTSEIWSARANGTLNNVSVTSEPGNGIGFHGSLTVIAFTNAHGTSVVARTGALSGEPDIYIPGVVAGDWVFAVGNDWDRAVARTPVSGQTLVHQRIDTAVGDTFWVQSTTAPSTVNGLVTIHDTQPTNDRWNYAAVEIVATHQ